MLIVVLGGQLEAFPPRFEVALIRRRCRSGAWDRRVRRGARGIRAGRSKRHGERCWCWRRRRRQDERRQLLEARRLSRVVEKGSDSRRRGRRLEASGDQLGTLRQRLNPNCQTRLGWTRGRGRGKARLGAGKLREQRNKRGEKGNGENGANALCLRG